MNSRLKWIEYQGKKIFFPDFSGLKDTELISTIKEGDEQMLKQPAGILLTIANMTNVKLTPVVKEA